MVMMICIIYKKVVEFQFKQIKLKNILKIELASGLSLRVRLVQLITAIEVRRPHYAT